MTEVTEMPQIQVIEKLQEIPLVQCAYNTSSNVYNSVKNSNDLLTWTFSSAEEAFMTALGAVAPFANKLQRPIHIVDDTLCKGLDILQEKVPIVKEPPTQIYMTAKTYVSDRIQPTVSHISATTANHVQTITNKSWDKANEVLATRVGNAALSGLDTASLTADQCIDYLLPAAEEEENIHPHPNSQCEDKVLHTVHTVGTLSTKVGRRVYRTFSSRGQASPQPSTSTGKAKSE